MFWLSLFLFVVSIFFITKIKKRSLLILNLFVILLYFLIDMVYLVSDYFTGNGIDSRVVTTLSLGIGSAGFYEYRFLILGVIASIMVLLYILFKYISYFNKLENKDYKLSHLIVGYFLLFLSFITMPAIKDIYKLYSNYNITQSKDLNRYLTKIKSNLSTKGNYNLVFIYGESLERTYFDNNLFPDLITNLKELRKYSVDFDNMNQVVRTGNTIAGTVSSQCGIPLFTPSSSGLNSMKGIDKFLPKANCMGDILKSNGYYLVEMQGSSVEFSGIGNFYRTHKFDEILGKDELLKHYHNTPLNGWGFYDDKLLEIVYNKFIDLSKTKDKFALFLATMDTHHPNGQLSPSCRNDLYQDGKNDILNCVKCSDNLISKFIKKIRNSKYGDKTIIVLISDHLAMRNTATHILQKGDRKDLFLVFLPKGDAKVINHKGTPLDIGTTVLHFLGIDINIGLGKNLFKESGLIAQFEDFNKKLLSWREEIIKLWDLPARINKIVIDKQKVKLNDRVYKIPLILKIDNVIKPIFSFDSDPLYKYLLKFDDNQKYVWVERCSVINKIYNV